MENKKHWRNLKDIAPEDDEKVNIVYTKNGKFIYHVGEYSHILRCIILDNGGSLTNVKGDIFWVPLEKPIFVAFQMTTHIMT